MFWAAPSALGGLRPCVLGMYADPGCVGWVGLCWQANRKHHAAASDLLLLGWRARPPASSPTKSYVPRRQPAVRPDRQLCWGQRGAVRRASGDALPVARAGTCPLLVWPDNDTRPAPASAPARATPFEQLHAAVRAPVVAAATTTAAAVLAVGLVRPAASGGVAE